MDLEALKAKWGKPPTEPDPLYSRGNTAGGEKQKPRVSLYDMPNEVLLKALSHLSTADLLPIALTSTRLHDLARRVLQGNLISAIGLCDLRVILETYHPSAQWTEPYLYCTYIDTPGLGLDRSFNEPFFGAEDGHPKCGQAREPVGVGGGETGLTTSDDLICSDPRAPSCAPRSMALLLRNVYSRFRPLVPNAMAVTETRHPAGGRIAVRMGNIQRALSQSASRDRDDTNQDSASASLSSSAPTTSTLGPEWPLTSTSEANAAALRNAMLLTDRLRTTNPNAGPASHAFAEGALLRAQMKQAETARLARRARASTGSSTGSTGIAGSPPSSALSQSTTFSSSSTADTPLTAPDLACDAMIEEFPLVSHMIRLDPDDSFSQLVVQTSLVGAEPRRGVFQQLLPINTSGVVRVWADWLAERANADAAGHRDDWAEKRRRTLWVDNARDVGLRVRVEKVDRAMGENETRDNLEEWRLQYEELLIRTAHLERMVERHEAGELGSRANQSIIFGSFLQR